MDASILHVDMDSFYASVEVLEDPRLKGKPVIVGGSGRRGVVASCNYEARAYGIHSAMPSMRARRLCPHAVFLSGRFDLYSDYSNRIHEVFRSFTPLVEGISLDEAFLDVAGAQRLFGTGEEIATQIRTRVASELGLSCAVGVATTKFIAKLASKAAKPRPSRAGPVGGAGVLVVEPGRELEFLHPLPVEALWGVGPATQKKLSAFGIVTVGNLAALPVETLETALGPAVGQHLHDLAWARDDRAVEPVQTVKSIGHEETYARDLHDHDAMRPEIVRMSDSVASRLRHAGMCGRTITVKVRFHDFRTITRSHTLPEATDLANEIAAIAIELASGVDPSSGVRLLGVSASNLGSGPARQLTLDGAGPAGWLEATAALDDVRRRFGEGAVGPASLVDRDGLRLKRQGDTQWGPDS